MLVSGAGLAVISLGLVVGMPFAFIGGLEYGGYACISHFSLRLILWHTNVVPPLYVRFLNESVDRTLLHSVGGGYSFIHRLLLDWFAKQYNGPETTALTNQKVVQDG